MKAEVEKIIEMIRVSLQQHGGDIELVDVEEETGTVNVRLQGACAGCPGSQMTLTNTVERALKEHVPGVKKVVNKNM